MTLVFRNPPDWKDQSYHFGLVWTSWKDRFGPVSVSRLDWSESVQASLGGFGRVWIRQDSSGSTLFWLFFVFLTVKTTKELLSPPNSFFQSWVMFGPSGPVSLLVFTRLWTGTQIEEEPGEDHEELHNQSSLLTTDLQYKPTVNKCFSSARNHQLHCILVLLWH